MGAFFGSGFAIAMLGVVLCALLCGVGSTVGLYKTSSAAAGVLGEDPKKFGKVILLVLLPATQGLYGFVIALLASSSVGAVADPSAGWAFFGACMPMAVSGLVTGIIQGKASANCIHAAGKQGELGIKLAMFPAMIEFYAILGLVVSIILVNLV